LGQSLFDGAGTFARGRAPGGRLAWPTTQTCGRVAGAGILDEAALVAASVTGDARAFGAIVERHQRMVYRICYRFTGRHEDAADLAQEVFLRAFRVCADSGADRR